MNSQKKLFEFLCTLINIQIKKYVALATVGIGPDARLNAKLVFNEVNELLELAQCILKDIEEQKLFHHIVFQSYFNQVKFYIEQEYTRAYAGWLLDANNIHTPVMDRVQEQLIQIKKIGQAANIDYFSVSEAVTEVQKQCEYDSCAIAFYILDLAKKIKENRDIEPDSNIPQHARTILKRNATTRYCLEEIAKPIDDLHKKYTDFLSHSDFKKSTSLLSKEDAKLYEVQHKEQWQKLFDRYQLIEPSSKLFSPDHEWDKISSNITRQKKSESIHASRNPLFFGGIVAAGAVAIYMLISYFMHQVNENSLESHFKF